jgi:hypothetical protein
MSRIFVSIAAICLAAASATMALSAEHHRLKPKISADVASKDVASNGPRVLTGEDIKKEIVGNSIIGIEKGETYVEYLSPDGKISGLAESGFYRGAWRVDGDKICVLYDPDEAGDPNANTWDCEPMARKGENIYWSDSVAADEPSEATLLAGNPKKL